MSGYPEGLSATAICAMEGCDWRGGGACVRCGARLRCWCGRYVTERALINGTHDCPVVTADEHRQHAEIEAGFL